MNGGTSVVPIRLAVSLAKVTKITPGKKNVLALNHDKGKRPIKKHDDNVCNRCGMTGYWSSTCIKYP